ncbi:MAG: ATP-binding cassette domain-containing protein [Frankiaceae bacterium]
MTAELLALHGVLVVSANRTLLRGVDWSVRAGERWVVLGPNGAGKTTLLQIAGALRTPSGGVVRLLGERVPEADPQELRSRIGFASTAVGDLLPAAETVLNVVASAAYGSFGRGAEPLEGIERERARSLLGQLGLRLLAQRPFGQLSEGERKRVTIARALMADPEVLLLDEPAAGLDLGAREALLRFLRRLAAEPSAPALVLVTHRVEEIPAGFTHALLLRAGVVCAAGPLEEALTPTTLSACFGFPLRLDRVGERWAATA